MKKIIVISDSFKGTISSGTIAKIAKTSIGKFYPECEIIALPVADGGEGTVECFLEAIGGEAVETPVCGPWREDVVCNYAKIGDTAIIEMAAAAGLPMVGDRKDPSKTTTFGVGLQIKHAAQSGAKKIILGLGGSATNDGGCGAAVALGGKFFNEKGEEFCPVGETLCEIKKIDMTDAKALLDRISVEVMCDIDFTLCGEKGAAAIFGPQKGADADMIKMLDGALFHMANVIKSDLGIDVLNLPGSAAAGGLGAGAVAYMGAVLRPGIEVVLDMVKFDDLLSGCELVITGEGRIDGQSLGGKVPVGVAQRAKKQNVPVIAIVGGIGDGVEGVYDTGINALFAINRKAVDFEISRHSSEENYRATLEDVIRFSKALR